MRPASNADPNERLRYIVKEMKEMGFESGLDVFRMQLKLCHVKDASGKMIKRDYESVRSVMVDGTFIEFLKESLTHPFMTAKKSSGREALMGDAHLLDIFTDIALREMDTEMDQLCKAFAKPARTYTHDELINFDWTRVQNEVTSKRAPRITAFLQALCKLDSNFEWMDSEQQKEVNGESKARLRAGRNQHLIVTIACSLLCFSRTRTANLVQGHIGYFLTACRVKKRCLSTLAKMGICVSYESTLQMAKFVALGLQQKLSSYLLDNRFCVWFWDNLDYMLTMKKKTIYKDSGLQHETQPYIYFPHTNLSGPCFLTEGDFDREGANRLTAEELIPDLSDYAMHAGVAIMSTVIMKHFPGAMRRVFAWEKSSEGTKRSKPVVKPIHIVTTERTEVFPLATIALSESRVENTVAIVDAIHQQLGFTPEQVVEKNMVIPCRGDLLTIRVLGSAMLQRSECYEYSSSLAYIEPTAGLFHTGMKLLEHLIKNYYGESHGKDPTSIHKFAKMFGENKVKKDFNAKDFRFCDNFIDDLLEGHIIAACMGITGCSTIDEFEEWLVTGISKSNTRKTAPTLPSPRTDWLAMITALVDAIFDSVAIQETRFNLETGKPIFPITRPKDSKGTVKPQLPCIQDSDKRNIPFQASLLFMRDALMYKDFWDSIRSGDTGRVIENIKYWTVVFQANNNHLYAKEFIHLQACLLHIWSDRAKQAWMDSCLIRLFGVDSDPMPEDEVGEDIIRERKELINYVRGTKDDHGKEVMVRQILTLRLQRKNMYKTTKATDYGDSYQESNNSAQVKAIAKELTFCRVFTYDVEKEGARTMCSAKDESLLHVPKDCWAEGCRKIIGGLPVTRYKETGRCDWEDLDRDRTEFDNEDKGEDIE